VRTEHRERASERAGKSGTAKTIDVLRSAYASAGSNSAAGPCALGARKRMKRVKLSGWSAIVAANSTARSAGRPRSTRSRRARDHRPLRRRARRCGVGDGDAPDVGKRREEAPHSASTIGVRVDLAQTLERGAGDAEQAVLHPHRDLRQQVQLVFGQGVVAFANRPRDRVVDRQQAEVGPAGQHGVRDGSVRGAPERRKRDPSRWAYAPRTACEYEPSIPSKAAVMSGWCRPSRRQCWGWSSDSHQAQEPPASARGSCSSVPGTVHGKGLPPKRFACGKSAVGPDENGHDRPMVPRAAGARQHASRNPACRHGRSSGVW